MNHDEGLNLACLKGSPHLLRRFIGPEAKELCLLCRPDPEGRRDLVHQARSAYGMLEQVLAAEGGSLEHVAQETVFFRDIQEDMQALQEVRARSLGERTGPQRLFPASTFIEQPPLDRRLRLEMAFTVVIPHDPASSFAWSVSGAPPCVCDACAQPYARVSVLGNGQQMRAGNVYGAPGSAFEEAASMFGAAEALLEREGMTFHNVVRTWIYLRDMDRDYADLNRARRAFFRSRGVELRPASTGIEGGPFPVEHNFSMGFLAVSSIDPCPIDRMTTPTLNEAWTYGSDFSRGLKVTEGNKTTLYISGTASIDEQGRTVHVEDLEGQVDRTLRNILTLLTEQGASFGDLVSAITYLKRPSDAAHLRQLLRARGIDNFPNAMVQANVCRPDLLVEMEAVALLPPRARRA